MLCARLMTPARPFQRESERESARARERESARARERERERARHPRLAHLREREGFRVWGLGFGIYGLGFRV
jgi:hypothetical protein